MLRGWKFEILLDGKSDKAIYLQIADAIINDIQSGRLMPREALPGSRKLAQLLKVNRNTVVEALDVLIMEGWLTPKERQGTFVSDTLPDFMGGKKSKRGTLNAKNAINKHYHLQFDDGSPDSKIAPITELARAYRQIFNQKARWQMMGYGNELGDLEFRKSIVQMLNHQRGMQVNHHNICITRGSQMAMYLTAQYLFTENDYVIVENPGYKPAWSAFENAGATLLPVGVDKDGLLIEEVIAYLKSGKKVRAIYVTPHHQYPTTVTLSLKRRLELIQLSNEYGFTIIEDDYDNEFHFGYRPVLPLSSFGELKNYVYIGSMSKVVAPALRIGYLVTHDEALMERVSSLRKIIDVQGDSIMEQAVLQLIKDGTIKRHIKKASHHYKAKRDFMAGLLKKYMEDRATYSVPEGGLAFWIVPNKSMDWSQIPKKLNSKGIKIISPDTYSFNETIYGIRLGYGSLSEKELEEGIIALQEIL
ncbi:GntR family transcriptional regulator [Sphingobacterium mizutaii NBRC 14946 = DSM 11724]|uniref:HTH-type transcriptional regulatory protein gabR n=2 Tax=Sphingobacterium mizutaii TaxID=1010 RepID=A0AAJ5BZZ2_9SPHI|nr:PLP-dependent aminotransferase family protein [Sphingobacterium mizutaii]GEM67108.1 GntR family transcriptional regulator [Sphingobacterium mizutaii NBRC 14946 = DSM 11724]SDK96910.1 GntR family transcriptional regulator / MocR family aminotransferase [Sphingobacterium mizutaii]SNV49129.1 HTH-type transcriptional regulatory protein gabR [Sphingobacterium mizutaii]